MWLEEQMDVHLPTMCNRTEICLSSSSDCNSSKQINGKSYITQCNCSCTGSSWLLPHRLYITFFSKSLFKGTPWDLSLKRKFKCCDSSLGCWGKGDHTHTHKNPTVWSLQKVRKKPQTLKTQDKSQMISLTSLALMMRKQNCSLQRWLYKKKVIKDRAWNSMPLKKRKVLKSGVNITRH